jgi:hypothetical protein
MAAKVSFMRGAAAYLVVLSVLALSGNLIHARAAATPENLNETIGYLLDFVANSDCAFIRNGSSYNSKEAAAHIKAKYDYFQKEIKTPEDFIRLAASKSEFSGRPYLVTTKDGYEMETAGWLRKALNDYRTLQRFTGRE